MATKKGSKKKTSDETPIESADESLVEPAGELLAESTDETFTESIDSMTDAVDVGSDLSDAKANRFYDRLRSTITAYVERRGPKLGKMKGYLLLVPDVFILMFRLFRDDRVSPQDKAILGTGLAYFIFPLDIMPEALMGPMGFLDDLVFAAYILNRMLLETDEEILREHWSGDEDVLTMIRRVLRAGDNLVSKKFVDRIKKIVG